MGEYNKAIPQYLTLIKKGIMNLSSVNLVERVGISYANDSNFENAIGYLKQIKTVDMSSDVKFETAFTYLQLKEYDQAIDIFKELRDSDPQYATLYPYLGQALKATNKIEDAYKVLQEGLSVDQYNEKLYLATARAALKLSETDDALKYLQEGNKIDPDDIEIVLELSNLLVFREDFDDNVKLLNTYIENHELDPQFYWNLAISYDKLDNLKLAHKNYLAAKPYFEDNADFLKEAALFFREYGDKDNSYELLSRYVKMQPNDEEAAFMLEEYLD